MDSTKQVSSFFLSFFLFLLFKDHDFDSEDQSLWPVGHVLLGFGLRKTW